MITALSVGTGGLGRFGNTMFTIAGCIGIAAKSGQPFAFPHWKICDNEKFGQPIDDMNDYFVNPLPELPKNIRFNEYGYFWGYRDIKLSGGNWSIDAHMQDPRFFSDYMPLIRHYFRMKDEPAQTEYVAIHYRAGDYIKDPNAYHPRCTKEYYEKAMAQFPEGTLFCLFSDNHEEWLDMMDNAKLYVIFSNHYMHDFAIMKACKSFITANSSFSLMAAILGEHPDKKIICPRQWFGTSAGLIFDGYPENAIVI